MFGTILVETVKTLKKEIFADRPFGHYEENCINYPGVGIIKDYDVADHVIAHTTIFDRIFNPRKMIAAAMMSQSMKMGIIEEPEGKWKY